MILFWHHQNQAELSWPQHPPSSSQQLLREQQTFRMFQTQQKTEIFSENFVSSAQTLPRNFYRGNSLPPQAKAALTTPVAPPRSRRGSRRGSMISLSASIQSLDLTGLVDRIKSMTVSTLSLMIKHPVHQSVVAADPPSRPPRRKDRSRKSTLFLDAIEEDQNKSDLPPREDDLDKAGKAEAPVKADDMDDKVDWNNKCIEPAVPMPGTVQKFQRATSVMEDQMFGRTRQPAVPMPGSVSVSKSVSDIVAASVSYIRSNPKICQKYSS